MRTTLGIVMLTMALGAGFSSTLLGQPSETPAPNATMTQDTDRRADDGFDWGWLGLLGLTGLLGLKRSTDRPVVRHDATIPSHVR